MADQEKITPEDEDVEGQGFRLKRKAQDEPRDATDEPDAEDEDVEAHVKRTL